MPVSDLLIRYEIYRFFADECRAPSAEKIAGIVDLPIDEVNLTFRRLHDRHMIFLDAETGHVRMANPFSAIPTGYRVRAGRKTWWANCAWDTMGIAAALGIDVEIEATHPVDEQRLSLSVVRDEVTNRDLIVYFPLPCRQWYDDLVYT